MCLVAAGRSGHTADIFQQATLEQWDCHCRRANGTCPPQDLAGSPGRPPQDLAGSHGQCRENTNDRTDTNCATTCIDRSYPTSDSPLLCRRPRRRPSINAQHHFEMRTTIWELCLAPSVCAPKRSAPASCLNNVQAPIVGIQ